MYILAIDPGILNFAFSVENVCTDTISALVDTQTQCLCGETVVFDNIALDSGSTREVTRVLDKYTHIWAMCDVVLVEKQMQFRGIINTKAIRIGHHCLSYFELRYPAATTIDYLSSNKTRVIGAPKGLTKPQRKKWSIQTVDNILERRGDIKTLELRRNLECKLDDVSDCTLMCLSYCIMQARKCRRTKRF